MKKGFTLLELVLVTAMIAMAASILFVLASQLQQRSDIRIAKFTVGNVLRLTQERAQQGYYDSPWSALLADGSVTMFRGSDVGSRDTSFDEIYTLPEGITVSGTTLFTFALTTGTPTANGTATLTSSLGETVDVTLNAIGTVLYE